MKPYDYFFSIFKWDSIFLWILFMIYNVKRRKTHFIISNLINSVMYCVYITWSQDDVIFLMHILYIVRTKPVKIQFVCIWVYKFCPTKVQDNGNSSNNSALDIALHGNYPHVSSTCTNMAWHIAHALFLFIYLFQLAFWASLLKIRRKKINKINKTFSASLNSKGFEL